MRETASRLSTEGYFELKARLTPARGRSETRFSAGAFVDGLLSATERKTGWMLAEEVGFGCPYRIQSLLGRSSWSADHLRDLVRDYVVLALGCSNGVLVINETGFLKKGRHSVGVGRPYSGTAGRIENSQIGVFDCYASRLGQALIDRQLYLPKDWATDEARRSKAHVPGDVTFATKPAMALDMIARTLDSGLPCAWVLADALYDADSKVRRMFENRRQEDGLIQTDPATLAKDLDTDARSPLSASEGTKGPRLYERARLSLSFAKNDDFER
jgi:SRSO17 transposase